MSAETDIKFAISAEDRFTRTFNTLRREIDGTRNELGGIASVAGRVSGALSAISLGTVAGIGGVGLMVKRLADDLDAFNDSADATGSSVEKLSQLERVARENGEGLDLVTTAVAKLNKVLSEAKAGSPMADALKRIGLSADDLRKLDPADAVREVAVALSGFADDGNKARLTWELTGKSAKEIAPYLKDLAEAGGRNATVTTEQAQQAERFNKELFQLEANARDVARGIGSALLPAANDLLRTMRELSAGPGLLSTAREFLKGNSFDTSQHALNYYSGELKKLDQQIAAINNNPGVQVQVDKAALRNLESQRQELERFATAYRNAVNAGGAGGGRGFVNPGDVAKPSVGPASSSPVAKPHSTGPSEAQRYLETLQKQGEKLQHPTALQQLEADIQGKRLDGLTPRLEAELRMVAQKVDLQRQVNAETERELGFQKLLSGKDQRDIDEVQRLLSQTKTGRPQGLEVQADKLRDFASRIGEDDPRTEQVREAMRALREEAERITAPTDAAKSAYDQLADSIEKSMERSTGSVIDFVLTGKSGVGDLGRAFAYDVLRGLIEEPVRKVMKNVAKEINDAISGASPFGDLLSSMWGSLMGSMGGGGLGFGGFGGFDFSSLFSGMFGRSSGGGVKAGQLVRWQENGTEYFVPGADGMVVNPSLAGGLGGKPPAVTMYNSYVINGAADPGAVQRQIEASVARSEARMARALRYGKGGMAV